MVSEDERAGRLLAAQANAVALFGAHIESYIAPGNTTPMRRSDKAGRVCHWILEIHLVDAGRRAGQPKVNE